MLLGLVCRAAIYSVELVTASGLTATLFLGAVVRAVTNFPFDDLCKIPWSPRAQLLQVPMYIKTRLLSDLSAVFLPCPFCRT